MHPRNLTRLLCATAIAATLATTSCKQPTRAPLDQPFTLRVGEAARIANGDLDLFFRRVAADSRCPAGVQCVWAGEAVVALEGRILKAPPESFDVKLSADSPVPAVFDGYRIRLTKLDPYPAHGTTPDTTAYVATFIVQKR